jgi:hypothetical protein
MTFDVHGRVWFMTESTVVHEYIHRNGIRLAVIGHVIYMCIDYIQNI